MGKRLIFVIFLLVSLGLLGGAYVVGNSMREFRDGARVVDGQVVGVQTSTDSEGDASYTPVYGYMIDGTPYTHEGSVSSSSLPTVGEPQTMLVDPSDPSDARADTFMDLWFLPVLLGGIGAVFLLVTLMGLAAGRRGRRTAHAFGSHDLDDHGSHQSANEATAMTTRSITADVGPASQVDLSGPFVTGNKPSNRGPFL